MKTKVFVWSVIFILFLSSQVIAEKHQLPEVPRISAILAYERYKTGKVILVNAMNDEGHKKNHILGAINMPNDGPSDLQRIREGGLVFPPDTEIIVYCK
jgi:hypothetical protein